MAVLGAVLGDIAGSQYEFFKPCDLDWKKCELFTDECNFTDDTVLTLATKYAILNNVSFADAYKQCGGIAEEFYKGAGLEEERLLEKYLDEYLLSQIKEKEVLA